MDNHNISPVSHHPTNFLDDSILFSQKSHYDPKDNPISPTPGKSENQARFQNEVQGFLPQAPTQSKDNLLNIMKALNNTLTSFGFSQLGDLNSNSETEIEKTINCIHELIQQRLKDIDFRKDVFERIAKLQHDKSMYIQTIERLKQENHNLSKEIGGLKNQFMRVEKKHKEEKEKLIAEKDLLSKSLAKHTQKITQYQHDLRKKEVDVNKVKDQMLKKVMNTNARHSAELLGSVNPTSFKVKQSAENELNNMVSYNVDTYRNKLLLENQELRSMLSNCQKDLMNLITEKKEEFIQRRMSEINKGAENKNARNYYELYFADVHFHDTKDGIFNMPLEKAGDEIVQTLSQNMKVFEYFIDKMLKFNYTTDQFKNLSFTGGVDQELLKMNNMGDYKKNQGEIKYVEDDHSNIQNQQSLSNIDTSKFLKGNNFGNFDFLNKDITGGHSPIGQKKEIDVSLCKELLDEFPITGRKDYGSTNDIENKFLEALNDKDQPKEEDFEDALAKRKTILQEASKWRNANPARASFGSKQ